MEHITFIHSTVANHEDNAARAFHAIHADDSAAFCLGDISLADFTAQTHPERAWFLTGYAGETFLGYLCLADWQHKSARIHFTLTRAGRPHGVALALHAIHAAFDTGLHSIYGIFPKSYRHITPFARRLGGQCLGEIPGMCRDSVRAAVVPGVVWVFTPHTINQGA